MKLAPGANKLSSRSSFVLRNGKWINVNDCITKRVWHAKRCIIRHFLYFYRILLHNYCIFWDLYLISGHFYSICFVSILYSMIRIQYTRLFLLYNFRLYCIFSHLHCIFLDLYLISGHFYSILLHYYCIFLDLYLISGHFYSI